MPDIQSIAGRIRKSEKRLSKVVTSKKQFQILLEMCQSFSSYDWNKSIEWADRAYQIANNLGDVALQIQSIALQANSYIGLSNYSQAIEKYETLIQLSYSINDYRNATYFNAKKAQALMSLSRYTEAYTMLQETLAIQERELIIEESATTLSILGNLYHYSLSDYRNALECLRKSYEIIKKNNNKKEIGNILTRIGNVYFSLGETETAIEYHMMSLKSHIEMKNTYGEAVSICNIGVGYGKLRQFEKALDYTLRGLEIQKINHYSVHEIASHNNISNIYIELSRIEEALKHSEIALNKIVHVENKYSKIVTLCQHGEVLCAMKDYLSALPFLLEALSLMRNGSTSENEAAALDKITFCYEQMGDFKSANQYQKKLMEIRIQNVRKQMDNDARVIEAKLRIEKIQAEKELLYLRSLQLERDVNTQRRQIAELGMEAIQKNEFLKVVEEQAKQILTTNQADQKKVKLLVRQIGEKINSEKVRKEFRQTLKTFHQPFDDFIKKTFPLLTKSERNICSFIQLGMTSKEIANLLFISLRTIEGHRVKIRKKMSIPEHQEINEFLSDLRKNV